MLSWVVTTRGNRDAGNRVELEKELWGREYVESVPWGKIAPGKQAWGECSLGSEPVAVFIHIHVRIYQCF